MPRLLSQLLVLLLLLSAGGRAPQRDGGGVMLLAAAAAPAPHALPWLWSGIQGLSPACNDGACMRAFGTVRALHHDAPRDAHGPCNTPTHPPSTPSQYSALGRLEAGLAAQDMKAIMQTMEAKVRERRLGACDDGMTCSVWDALAHSP